MKWLAIFTLLFSTSLFSQEIINDLSEVKKDLKKSKFSGQYSFTKRVLDETDFMKTYREQRIVSDKVYISPDQIDFDLHTFGFRFESNSRMAYEVAGSYMKSNVNLTGEMVTGKYTPTGAPPWVKVPIFGRVNKSVGSEGMGDTRIGFKYKAYRAGNHTITTSGHLNLPTGSVEEEDEGYVFPYAGQLGSGTYDLLPEVKYNYRETGFVAGTRLNYTLRTGRNKSDYRMGNQSLFDSFVGYDYKRMVAIFLKGRIRDWKASSDPRYEVAKPRIDDPYVQKGRRWEVLATARTGLPLPWNLGAVIVEGGVPIYQDQKAGEVQLETAWYLTSRVVASF